MISPFKAAVGGDYKQHRGAAARRHPPALRPVRAHQAPNSPRRSSRPTASPPISRRRRLAGFSDRRSAASFRRAESCASRSRRSISSPCGRMRRNGGFSARFRRTRRRARMEVPECRDCTSVRSRASRRWSQQTGARSLVTLLEPGHDDRPARRRSRPIATSTSAMSDIVERRAGPGAAATRITSTLCSLSSADWDRAAPMLIHCFAGVSRSTASAYIAACALERRIATSTRSRQRLRAASPTATPNARFVALADARLQREGRMSAAIAVDRPRRRLLRGRAVRARTRMTTIPHIRIEIDGPVSTIVIDRPDKRNAVDGPMARALPAPSRAFEADAALQRVAVLYGEGGTFCAGADFSAIGDPARRARTRPRGRRHRADGADADGAAKAADRGVSPATRSPAGWNSRCSPTCASPRRARCSACSAAAGACR